MANAFYDLSEILIYDPVSSSRAATRSALYALGCRNIEMAANLRDFSSALEQRPPDLALCEAPSGEVEICRIVQQMRRGGQYPNPFVIVIISAWSINAELSNTISESGADSVILRPFSPAQLDQRIQAHVHNRKRFVAAPEYVGPERRSEGHRVSTAASFDPPTSLKIKADGRSDPEYAANRFAVELKKAREKLAKVLPFKPPDEIASPIPAPSKQELVQGGTA